MTGPAGLPVLGPRRALVLGASGFLGAHVRRQAAAAGMEVVTAGRSPLPGSPAHCQLDLAAMAPGDLAQWLARQAPDVVLNCAGATGGDVAELAVANVTATAALVTALRQTGRSIRLVHLGSAAEYGPGEPGTAVPESAPARPAAAYGATKLAGTRLVELGRATGLDAVVLRVFNPVGPGAPETILPGRLAAQLRRATAAPRAVAGPAATQAAADFRRAAETGDGVRLGSLDGVRDYVDVRDVADAALAAATAPGLPTGVINVGSGAGTPVRELVKELVAISGYDGPVTEDSPAAGPAASRGGPVASWQQADISRARRDLDWQPRRSLAASLTDLWQEAA